MMRVQENSDHNWLDRQLKGDEYVLWSGKPVLGKIFHGYDVFLIPFSIMWCAISLFAILHSFKEDLTFVIFLIPFVLIGVYLLVGRFIHVQILKRHTDYAVTSERILRRQGKKADYLLLRKIPVVDRTISRDGTGSITFGREPVEMSLVYCRIRMPFYREKPEKPVFYLEDVPDVEKVYQIISEQIMA